MGKVGFRHMPKAERERIARVARRMFADGYTIPAVCDRFKIPMTTLRNICRERNIEMPRQRRGKPD